jgi:hypothetical protein
MSDNYKFVTKEGDKWASVAISDIDSPYDGVVYSYGGVKLPDLDGDDARLSFNYNLIDKNELPSHMFEGTTWQNLIGDILVDIIDEQVEKGEGVIFKGGS